MELDGDNSTRSKGSHSVRKQIPIKLKSSSRGRGRPRKTSSRTSNRSSKKIKEEDAPAEKEGEEMNVDDIEFSTMKVTGAEPIHKAHKLKWDHKVNLIGMKVLDPIIHSCETCMLPILIYGRMIPCKHVFCFDCGKKTDKVCPRCNDPVNRVEQSALGAVFVCNYGGSKHGVTGCRRTYLSQRDLQAHINYRHLKEQAEHQVKQPQPSQQPVKQLSPVVQQPVSQLSPVVQQNTPTQVGITSQPAPAVNYGMTHTSPILSPHQAQMSLQMAPQNQPPPQLQLAPQSQTPSPIPMGPQVPQPNPLMSPQPQSLSTHDQSHMYQQPPPVQHRPMGDMSNLGHSLPHVHSAPPPQMHHTMPPPQISPAHQTHPPPPISQGPPPRPHMPPPVPQHSDSFQSIPVMSTRTSNLITVPIQDEGGYGPNNPQQNQQYHGTSQPMTYHHPPPSQPMMSVPPPQHHYSSVTHSQTHTTPPQITHPPPFSSPTMPPPQNLISSLPHMGGSMPINLSQPPPNVPISHAGGPPPRAGPPMNSAPPRMNTPPPQHMPIMYQGPNNQRPPFNQPPPNNRGNWQGPPMSGPPMSGPPMSGPPRGPPPRPGNPNMGPPPRQFY